MLDRWTHMCICDIKHLEQTKSPRRLSISNQWCPGLQRIPADAGLHRSIVMSAWIRGNTDSLLAAVSSQITFQQPNLYLSFMTLVCSDADLIVSCSNFAITQFPPLLPCSICIIKARHCLSRSASPELRSNILPIQPKFVPQPEKLPDFIITPRQTSSQLPRLL